MSKKDANKTGFPASIVATCKGDFKTFETWFNKHYEGLTAKAVWDKLNPTAKEEAKK